MSNMPGTFLRSPARLMYVFDFALAIALGAGIHLLTRLPVRLPAGAMLVVLIVLVAHVTDVAHHARAFLVLINPHREPFPTEQRDNLQRAFETAQGYAEEPEGWLVFVGDYGCGKTHLAAAIANARVAEGMPALFVVVPDLLDHLRAAFNPASTVPMDRRFEEVRSTPLLVLDDLGASTTTPWAQEKLYQLLNHRYNARLATVITTNQHLEEIEPRLRSRILDPRRVTVFAIVAPSYLDRLSTRGANTGNGRANGNSAPPPASGPAARPRRRYGTLK
jgi:hypothetical protein